MEESIAGIIVAPIVVGILFIGLPWLLLHYITKWKQARGLSIQDEALLDEMHDLARRLDDRLTTIERIIAADREAAREANIHQLRKGQ